MRSVSSLNLKKQRVLMRVDFNVPLKGGVVTDEFRIQAVLPTISFCLNEGASVTLMSHLGRPGGKSVGEMSLLPVGEVLSDLLEKPLKFSDDCISEDAVRVSQNLAPGEIHLLENLRFHPGETDNELAFGRKLSRHGTVYVNDAFGTAHRAHASNVGVVRHFQEKAIGFLMERELKYLRTALENPRRPLVILLGGAKIGTKLGIISRFLREADSIVIGGAMAFTFLRSRGYAVGESLVEEDLLKSAESIVQKARMGNVPFHLPTDFVITRDIAAGRSLGEKDTGELLSGEIGVDIGTKTIRQFREVVSQGGTVLWNGPMGVFESSEFRNGTLAMAISVSKVAGRGGISIIGGGDTVAAVRMLGLDQKMSHLSTGGGASLELLAGKKLPAFAAIEGQE